MHLKLKELNKRQRRKVKELNKAFAEKYVPPLVFCSSSQQACPGKVHESTFTRVLLAYRAKCPEKAAEAMRLAAEAAIKEQTKLAQSEMEMGIAKKEAIEALAAKESKLAHSNNLVNQLKDLCRELQHKSQQV